MFERHDLALAKLGRNQDYDREDVRRLALDPGLDVVILEQRYREEQRWRLGNPEREDRTLPSHEQMRAIIHEASGERALHTLHEMVPYTRVRPASEYQGAFRESEVMARRAKEFGFTNVRIESFPSGPQWQPSLGELWITAPVSRKTP